MDRILIVRGVENFDDLKPFGLPMAKKVADADIVIAVNSAGKSQAIKSKREQLDISFIDSDSHLNEIVTIIKEMKELYVRSHPDTPHLAHAFVGMWLFYWIGGFGNKIAPLPVEMIAAGDIGNLRESAKQFIETDFGNRTTTSEFADSMPSDGGAHAEAKGVPGSLS